MICINIYIYIYLFIYMYLSMYIYIDIIPCCKKNARQCRAPTDLKSQDIISQHFPALQDSQSAIFKAMEDIRNHCKYDPSS